MQGRLAWVSSCLEYKTTRRHRHSPFEQDVVAVAVARHGGAALILVCCVVLAQNSRDFEHVDAEMDRKLRQHKVFESLSTKIIEETNRRKGIGNGYFR